ncbi:exodeoxyribonuclease V subunit alpha [Aliiglaciecola litoralis]|uniref:exodeoxyribonuclease V subunit alpha n=1 Tax=Aliiglaciecola litoralis TaxID=582857 RepID=UPI0031E0C14A
MQGRSTFASTYAEPIRRLALTDLDIAFASFIFDNEKQDAGSLALLAAWVSHRLNQQDTCVAIDDIAPHRLAIMGFESQDDVRQKIAQSRCFSAPLEQLATPIIVDLNRLYLHKYYQYEWQLAQLIKHKVAFKTQLDMTLYKDILLTLFAPPKTPQTDEIDWQCVAVCIAALRRFTLITGGPGTGKTTTVAKLLALLNTVAKRQNHKLTIKLVAPTGKAAARLTESIDKAKERLPNAYQQGLEMQCSTIHRLLGSLPNRVDFKHNASNPLHLDVLIVDEASMVDLPLMYRLFSALPSHAKVVLLGDHNQLSSVETGSVLSDICQAAQADASQIAYHHDTADAVEQMSGIQLPKVSAEASAELSECYVKLRKSHRFSADSDIGQLANEIIAGQAIQAARLLQSEQNQKIQWRQNSAPQNLVDEYVSHAQSYFDAIAQNDLTVAFNLLSNRQILCAFKTGSWGTQSINRLIENVLIRSGTISPDKTFYAGRPIMLAKNDHSLGLFNGDIGIVLPDPANPVLTKAWFKVASVETDQTKEKTEVSPNSGFKGVLVSRLPEHETVYAMTIHKSQGSEFHHIDLCLPQQTTSQSGKLLSRELLYTGLTRARESFHLYAASAVLDRCLKTLCKRGSGLHRRL